MLYRFISLCSNLLYRCIKGYKSQGAVMDPVRNPYSPGPVARRRRSSGVIHNATAGLFH